MALESLPPDDLQRHIAMHITLKPCPFCGHEGPLLLDYVNPAPQYGKSPVFQSRVVCDRCTAQIIFNGTDRQAAQQEAIDRWQRRPSGGA